MIRKLLFTLGLVLAAQVLVFSQATGTLRGKITDKETKEPIPFANVVIEMNGVQAGGATSDFEGNYVIKPITPGKYDIRCSYVGYKTLLTKGLIIGAGKIEFYNIELEPTTVALSEIEVTSYKVPLIEKDQTSVGATVTSEQIDKMPNRSATAVAVTIGGVFSADGERGSVRGARSEATVTYIDGVKVTGSASLPPSAIEQVSVIISGLPAQYGDATSGVINVTTKGPSNIYAGGFEAQTSELLDNFGYNRFGFNLQGPIIRKKNKETGESRSILGFFLAGDLTLQGDAAPSPIGRWKVKDDVLQYLKENPLRPTGLGYGTYPNAAFLGPNDLEHVKSSQNADAFSINLSGKIDLRLTNTTNFTLGGSTVYYKSNAFGYSRSLMNWENNPYHDELTYRGYARFTQRFPTSADSRSLIKNVYYSLQADFTKFHSKNQSAQHKDNLFKYGYLGRFDTYTMRSYELGGDTINGQVYSNVYIHNGYRDTMVTFQPSDFNRDLARYTETYYNFYPDVTGNWENFDQILLGGGYINGMSPDAIYSLWQAPGTVYNGYNEYDANQIGFNGMFSADIGNHEVQFGIQYEQRSESYFAYAPVNFWQLMRGLTNFHIRELDKSNPVLVSRDGVFQDTIYYYRKYDANSQRTFDRNLRKKLGLPVDGLDFINIDSYDFASKTINYYDKDGNLKTVTMGEDLFDVSLFSADELLNGGNSYVAYYGYDYTGKKLTSQPSFEDFLTKKNADGDFLREVPAFQPNYFAGYIQDKFAFKDLIFNVGVRVDRFDANQLVLKDPYSIYPTLSVKEVQKIGDQSITHPGNMGPDYVVYVDNATNPTSITGYRSGSVWYNASGIEIADPYILDAGSGVTPYLRNPSNQTLQKEALQDYEPQWAIMPRISFSFPISEEALFFAHYDILTQRPQGQNRFDITDYYFFRTRGTTLDNPNLKSPKTIDYELGFKQRLTNSSALTLSAYYKEIRNEIQIYRYSGAYPRDYVSYNNIDFGTVKGFTVSYDLRRTSNVTLRGSYTLQFADGTGSSPTTAAALIAARLPNLRTPMPLAWDRRHSFNVNIDYRYGEGKEYNGPRINRKNKPPIELLRNTGINFTVIGGSGTPYTRSENITSAISGGTRLLKGSFYGSRLPWQFRIDAKLDKDINIVWKKNEGEKPKESMLNIYLQMLNIFNFKNVMAVYPATGNPDDDGYLAAAEWQREINQQLNPDTYRQLYQIYINNPANYSSPRMIRLGLIFNF